MAKKRKPSTSQQSQPQQPKKIQKKSQNQQQNDEEQQQLLEQQQQQQQLEEEQQQEQQQQEEMAEQEQEEQQENDEIDEEPEEQQEEEQEEEENDEIDENEDENNEETKKNDVVIEDENDDDDEPISNLLEPFTKDQLVMILREAAEIHPDVASRIRKVADEDPVHRKIFVHGLGWDTNEDTLKAAFSEFGDIEDCKSVTDKLSGKSKGYGFILFKSRAGARKALKEPQKKIGNRMTACQLAAVGPGPGPGMGPVVGSGPGGVVVPGRGVVSEYTQRKIYVSNVAADIDPQKLVEFFSSFGEIEEGPLGLDKQTGKPKGFCLFVYKSVESAKKALEEPHKQFEGHVLHCQKAVDGPKPGKSIHMGGGPPRGGKRFGGGRGGKSSFGRGGGGRGGGGHGLGGGYNQGAVAAPAPAPALNPALGQALTALLASQGAGLGLNNLLGSIGGGAAAQGVYGAQNVGVDPSVLGGYGTQSGYPNQQMGQGGSARSQHGHYG